MHITQSRPADLSDALAKQHVSCGDTSGNGSTVAQLQSHVCRAVVAATNSPIASQHDRVSVSSRAPDGEGALDFVQDCEALRSNPTDSPWLVFEPDINELPLSRTGVVRGVHM